MGLGRWLYEPHHEKSRLRDLRPGKTQTNPLRYSDQQSEVLYYPGKEQQQGRRSDCADALFWSAPLLLAYGKNRVSHDAAHIWVSMKFGVIYDRGRHPYKQNHLRFNSINCHAEIFLVQNIFTYVYIFLNFIYMYFVLKRYYINIRLISDLLLVRSAATRRHSL